MVNCNVFNWLVNFINLICGISISAGKVLVHCREGKLKLYTVN